MLYFISRRVSDRIKLAHIWNEFDTYCKVVKNCGKRFKGAVVDNSEELEICKNCISVYQKKKHKPIYKIPLATDKQILLLKKMRVDFKSDINIRSASDLIGENLSKNNKTRSRLKKTIDLINERNSKKEKPKKERVEQIEQVRIIKDILKKPKHILRKKK